MKSIAKIEDSSKYNFLGLTKGQALLYRELERCAKKGEILSLDNVLSIYFLEIKDPEAFWDEKNREFRIRNMPDDPINFVKNKEVVSFFQTNEKWRGNFKCWVLAPVRNWMKNNIGSLVMRGLLEVVPKLDTDLIEK